jgi:hypothetical protein
MNIEMIHTTKTNCGIIYFEAQGALHRINMGNKLNIIDDVNAFLFIIWFDKLKGIHW